MLLSMVNNFLMLRATFFGLPASSSENVLYGRVRLDVAGLPYDGVEAVLLLCLRR